MTEKTKQSFLRDTKDHQIKILKDDGVYRHLSFTNNGSSVYRFDLITWPWCLCYTGDMGTYVFRRLEDMLCFFRGELKINSSYWAEKLEAVDRCDGLKEWSEESFEESVKYDFDMWAESAECSSLEKDDIWESIKSDILSCSDNGHEAHQAVEYFDHEMFNDFWEHDCTEYVPRFIWCLYAIVWGIQKYDESKKPKEEYKLITGEFTASRIPDEL